MSESLSKQHATATVNSLLSTILPGASKIVPGKSRASRNKGSNAQLINKHLKQVVAIRERDVHSIKKREHKARRKILKTKQAEMDAIDQTAKLEILRKHQAEGTLTNRERKYLNKVISKNIRGLKSWDTNDEELQELQNSVLGHAMEAKMRPKSKTKRRSKKEFNEERQSNKDHRYPGLTPGLAPVGASDEEDSSQEEDEDSY